MSINELILTFCVALIVLGPKKLPLLAHHLSKAFSIFQTLHQKVQLLWSEELAKHQLEENLEKALKADRSYQEKTNAHDSQSP